ncbi:MAG: Hsp20/alpha crystallin family protein, partial [Chloroflexi bacterium]|nr:Hsp20/alpha crystallin family protein [Chloroflexota bacterium]
EKGGEILLTAELPGMAEDGVEINLENDVLTISGEKRGSREEGEPGGKYHLVERSFGSFRRSFTLPRTVRADGIKPSAGRSSHRGVSVTDALVK